MIKFFYFFCIIFLRLSSLTLEATLSHLMFYFSPYQKDIIGLPPYQEIALEEATEFSCKNKAIRHPKETKGSNYNLTEIKENIDCCTPEECC